MISVHLQRADHYSGCDAALDRLLHLVLPDPRGLTVLLKPNFVAARNAALACTHPRIIALAARYCLDRGAHPVVGDAPAFGTAAAVARAIGLEQLLAPLGVPIVTLDRGVRTACGGIAVPISSHALEADLILNLPKFKAHSQMRYTGAVKNLFGCVSGVHKAWLHARHGDKEDRFREMLRGILAVLPPVVSVMDGITAMHVTGPITGEAFPLGLLGASSDPVALDTAAGLILRCSVDAMPIWKQCSRHGMPGADPDRLDFPELTPNDFDAGGFQLPQNLKPESFRPDVLLRSLVKRLWLTVTGT